MRGKKLLLYAAIGGAAYYLWQKSKGAALVPAVLPTPTAVAALPDVTVSPTAAATTKNMRALAFMPNIMQGIDPDVSGLAGFADYRMLGIDPDVSGLGWSTTGYEEGLPLGTDYFFRSAHRINPPNAHMNGGPGGIADYRLLDGGFDSPASLNGLGISPSFPRGRIRYPGVSPFGRERGG